MAKGGDPLVGPQHQFRGTDRRGMHDQRFLSGQVVVFVDPTPLSSSVWCFCFDARIDGCLRCFLVRAMFAGKHLRIDDCSVVVFLRWSSAVSSLQHNLFCGGGVVALVVRLLVDVARTLPKSDLVHPGNCDLFSDDVFGWGPANGLSRLDSWICSDDVCASDPTDGNAERPGGVSIMDVSVVELVLAKPDRQILLCWRRCIRAKCRAAAAYCFAGSNQRPGASRRSSTAFGLGSDRSIEGIADPFSRSRGFRAS